MESTLVCDMMIIHFQVSHSKCLRINKQLFIIDWKLLYIESDVSLSKIVISMLQSESKDIFNIWNKFFSSVSLGLFQDCCGFEVWINNDSLGAKVFANEL